MSKPKITRNALKAVIKECLMEILTEGIGPNAQKQSTTKKSKSKAQQRRTAPTRATQPNFENAVRNTAEKLTSDPVMAAIFEDTARTTLQEQIQNETSPSVSSLQSGADNGPVAPGRPEDLFEGSSNWAELAFAEKKPV